MNRKLAIGVLGVGDMGRCHAENIRRVVSAAYLVALADVNLERTKKVAVECEGIDVVVIACPDKFHAKSMKTGAARTKDIFCEMPIATNLSDAHSALRRVATTEVCLQIGFMGRYDPAHQQASEPIEGGQIGQLDEPGDPCEASIEAAEMAGRG